MTEPADPTRYPRPELGPWVVVAWPEFAEELRSRLRPSVRPVVAIDGASGAGKSVLAARLGAAWPGSTVVATDDVAWWESFFGWDGQLVDGVLAPARRGQAVSFRPPAWDRRERQGAIEVPAGPGPVIVEGVGSSRRSLTQWIDGSVWVDVDPDLADRRLLDRDGTSAEALQLIAEWGPQEAVFLAEDRSWERATLVVSTSSGPAVDSRTQVAARADPPGPVTSA